MKFAKLEDMVGGWFAGSFEPSVMKSSEFEVAVKHYSGGDSEPCHFHAIATEVTVVVNGEVSMNEHVLRAGDIAVIAPGERVVFRALTDSITVVVKSPSLVGDKFVDG